MRHEGLLVEVRVHLILQASLQGRACVAGLHKRIDGTHHDVAVAVRVLLCIDYRVQLQRPLQQSAGERPRVRSVGVAPSAGS